MEKLIITQPTAVDKLMRFFKSLNRKVIEPERIIRTNIEPY